MGWVERFWSKVYRTSGCWLWTGTVNWAGYGVIGIDGSMKRAHRVAYELVIGPIPSGMNLLHSCDVRWCVNPDHLRIGTQRENMDDMAFRGRARFSPFRGQNQRGEANRQARLTERDVREIRQRREAGESLRSIGARYGVSDTLVCGIAKRRFWSHVA